VVVASLRGAGSVPAQCARGSLGDNKLGYPVFLCGDSRCFVYFQEKSICFLSRRPSVADLFFEHQPDLLGHLTARGLLTSASMRHPLFSTSPRPTGSTLPSHLRLTSLWLAFRPSLNVCWLYLIPVRSAIIQATTAPCLHFKPPGPTLQKLDVRLRTRSGGFYFLIPVHPTRPHRIHVFTSY
jgi:hypothetical protein